MTARDFSRKKIAEIATQYAKTDFAYSHEYFSKEYGISKGTFYTVLEKAVIENIVDSKIVKLMAEKSENNSYVRAGIQGQYRSRKHYSNLIAKRKKYMLPKNEAINITEKYAESNVEKAEFAEKNNITITLLNRTIYKAITENWVSDNIVSLLKRKSLCKDSSQQVIQFWKNIEQFRENKKSQG